MQTNTSVGIRGAVTASPMNLSRPAALAAALAATAVAVVTAAAGPAAAQEPASPPASNQAATPVDPGAEYLKAFDMLAGAYANDSNAGRTVGAVAGAAVGCGVGAVTGGTLTMLVSAGTLTPLGAIGGCILGAGTVSFFGGAVGGAITGLPAVGAAWPQAYDGLHSKGLVAAPVPGSPS